MVFSAFTSGQTSLLEINKGISNLRIGDKSYVNKAGRNKKGVIFNP